MPLIEQEVNFDHFRILVLNAEVEKNLFFVNVMKLMQTFYATLSYILEKNKCAVIYKNVKFFK